MSPTETAHPATAPEADVGEFLASCAPDVNAFVDRALPAETGPAATLASAMRYAVLGGGKRIRPTPRSTSFSGSA